ncbi:MAG: RagB/SusD family nutrient uptake outer membrane protein [Bacteroidota bacterium]
MKKIALCTLVAILFAISCAEEDLNKLNPNQLVPETFYKNEAELQEGVNSIYASLQSTQLYSREMWFLHDLRSDDNVSGGGQLETPRNQLLIGTHDPANPVMGNVWSGLYRVILRANIVINNAPNAEDISSDVRDRIVGEALFARGFAYYQLGTLWGGVPIFTEFATAFDDTKPRSTQEETMAQAISDLQAAASSLPEKSATDPGRFTRGAANGMLGRAHLFLGDYTAAKTALQNVVNSGEYSLVDEYDDNFQEENEYNTESVMEIGYADIGQFNWNPTGDNLGNEGSVRSQEYSAIGWRNLIPSPSLIEEHESPANGDEKRDPRLDKNFYFTGDPFAAGASTLTAEAQRGNSVMVNGEEQKISWRKYSIMYKLDPGGYRITGINHRVLRYAEVLINLAEAELESGNRGTAVDLLNQVRARPSVDMPAYPTANYPVSTDEEVMRAIIHEKRVEHCSEQIRNIDIIRWRKEGKLDKEPLDYFVAGKYELLPIPQGEIDNNPNISDGDQNPGY